jgi:polysaccharide biosynthesis transport protein
MSEERTELAKPLIPEENAIIRPFTAPKPSGLPYNNYGSYGADQQPGGLHLRELWRIVRKRRWLVLIIAVIATILVTVEVYRTPSIYRAQALVGIKKEGTTVVQTDQKFIQIDDSDTLNTKKIIIKSRPLLEDIVVMLKLDQHPRFVESLQKKSVMGALRDMGRRFSGPLPEAEPPAERETVSQAALLQNRSSEESQQLGPYVNILRKKLDVETMENSHVLQLSFEHTDPQLAAAIVNAAAENFIRRSFENKTSRFEQTSSWLDRSTRELKGKMQQAEQELADYTRRNQIFSLEGNQSLTTEKLAKLHAQVLQAETDRMLKESLYEEVKSGRTAQLPEAFADPKTGTLEQKVGELRVQQAELSVKYGPENPRVAEVEQKIKTMEGQITGTRRTLEERLKADYERAARDERSLKQALDSAKGEAVQQNQAAIQLSVLRQNADTAKSLYNDFLQKTNQADLQLAQQHKDLHIIEPAEAPGSPIGPQRLRTILIGLLVSLIAGVGLAFFLEYLDNTVKSVEDIERFAQLPTLAVIPSINSVSQRALTAKRKELQPSIEKPAAALSPNAPANGKSGGSLTKLVTLDQLSSVVEAYRMLRTSVLLSAAGNPPKIILFTSGQPGEGKTTTAINTAISLSQLGSSVLLIDADLRRPTVHRVFKMNQTQGLSTYLSRQVEIDPLISKLWVPNLSVLPCGAIPPNPAELISSERMRDLLQKLSDRYDHILIDSPPLINVTDPVILSTMVDGVILVVQAGRSTRDIVRRARQELSSVGAKIFGVVLNNLDIKREGYDSYISAYGGYYGENRSEAARR